MPAPLKATNLATVSRLPKGETAHRLFFFREELPPGAHNVHHAYAPVEKVPVTFQGWDEEQGSLASFASSIVALQDGYRLYATVRSGDRERCDIRAWDSSDGLRWKPTPIAPEAADGAPNRVPINGLPEGSDFIAQPQIVPPPRRALAHVFLEARRRTSPLYGGGERGRPALARARL